MTVKRVPFMYQLRIRGLAPKKCIVYRVQFLAESAGVCMVQDPTATLTNPIKPSCKQPDVAFRGSMVYWYNSTSWRDDMAWAASWMFRASGDPNYLSDAYGFYRTHKDLEGELDIRYLVSCLIWHLLAGNQKLSTWSFEVKVH